MAKHVTVGQYTGKAASEGRNDKMMKQTKAVNRDFLKGLTSMLATSGHTATARTRLSPAFDPTDPCKVLDRQTQRLQGASCRWKATHIPNKTCTGAEATTVLKAQA